MNRKFPIWSILWGLALLLAAACGRGDGEFPRGESKAALRTTPDPARGTLTRYRGRGIEPRRARFAREWEE